MNERIEKLIEQANELDYKTFDEHNHQTVQHYKFNKEKFAELIVRECGNWFNSRLVVEPDYGMEHRIQRNRAVVGVMKEFNQHFGVEE